MLALSAKEIFYRKYHGNTNFITPHILQRGKAGRRRAYELSTGTGFEADTLYGVTVLDVTEVDGDYRIERNDGLSKLFFDERREADEYIANLPRLE
jgi:hypothetical protein